MLALLSPLAAPAAALQGPLGRHQVIGAFRRLLLAASAGGCVMLQVDDAHLIEDADVDVMLHLSVTGHPVLVVLAVRPPAPQSALGQGVSRLVSAGHLAAIDLDPLADDDALSLATQAAPRPLAADVLGRIVRLADGNPFAAIELARCAGPAADWRLPATPPKRSRSACATCPTPPCRCSSIWPWPVTSSMQRSRRP